MSSHSLLLIRLLVTTLLVLCTGCHEEGNSPVVQGTYPSFSQISLEKKENKLPQPQDKTQNIQEKKLIPPEETTPCDEDIRVAGEMLQAHYNETQYMPDREDRIVILMIKMNISQKKAEAILDVMMLD